MMTVSVVTCQENNHHLEIVATMWQHRLMSVNQNTVADKATADAKAPESSKAERSSERTDMVGKALGLLVLLGDEPRGASAAEISRRAELPFSTTYRLLGSLTRDGFVDYEPEGRRYHLGQRIIQ
jgi:hypothetical protein